MKSRIIFTCFVLCFFYFAFFIRGAWLQFFPDQKLITAKKKNFQTVIKLKPRRGIIYDQKGRELAITVASQSLFADPSWIKNPGRASQKLSRLLKVPRRQIYKKISDKTRRFVWLKRHISEKESRLVESWKIRGLAFLEEPKRVYPNGSLLAQTLGFVGREGHGLEGVELSYDKVLSGEEKQVMTRKDAFGRPLFSDINTNLITLRTNGADIYLTIDSDLQFFFEKELKKVIEEYSAKSALGIIMEPQTGKILAIAHSPSFNLNQPFKSEPQLFRNRSVTDAFEPGSTLKPFIISSALKKDIPPSTVYDGMEGKLLIDGHVIREAESTHQFKDVSLRDILSYSSNVGAAQVALALGDNFLYQGLKDFGFGSKLGITFPGENAGILHKPPWKKLQLATIGFGHAISVTPLQMATAYSAIANGGLLMKPYLVESVYYKENGRKKFFKPEVLGEALSREQAKNMTVMLISAVSEGGTGSKARVKGFQTAGKTGTAQVVDMKSGGYVKDQYISSFAGFIPAHDPKFVIYVVVHQPQKKFYGSTVAAPVFSKVAEYAVRQSGLSPILVSEQNILRESQKIDKKPEDIPRGLSSQEGKTPDFLGLSLRSAYQKARQEKVRLRVKGSGLVFSTIPAPASPLPSDRTIQLILK